MSGMPGRSGGHNKKSANEHLLAGTFRKHRHKPVAPAPVSVERFDPPWDLPQPDLAVWERLAGHAFAVGTLTRVTEQAFLDLCSLIVMRDGIRRQIESEGYGSVSGKHPLLPEYRGLVQRVESTMARFAVTASGRPAAGGGVAAPVDPFGFLDQPAAEH